MVENPVIDKNYMKGYSNGERTEKWRNKKLLEEIKNNMKQKIAINKRYSNHLYMDGLYDMQKVVNDTIEKYFNEMNK